MAQHDYVIANGTGAAVRSDLNNGLAAIVSNNSGATEPATMYAYQWWSDTTTGLLKLRNAANSAWVTVGTLASANLGLAALASPTFTGTVTAPAFTASTAVNIPLGSAGSPTLFFTGDTNNGLFSPGADIVALTTDGSERFRIAASGQIGLGGANYGTSGQALTSNGSGSAPTWQTLSVTGDKISEGNTEAEVVDTGSDGHFKVTTEGSERLRVDPSGRLLVGTSTGTSRLSIAGTADNANSEIQITATGVASGYIGANSNGLNIGTDTAGLVFKTGVTGGGSVGASGTERMRITSSGFAKFSNTATYAFGVGNVWHTFNSDQNYTLLISNTKSDISGAVFEAGANRVANSGFSLIKLYSDYAAVSPDIEFNLRGDGTGLCDGSWTGGGADYAEYFEWSDSNPSAEDRRGISVVLDGNKIREAVAGEDPIGVISGNPSVVGDAAWNKWSGKYLRDEFSSYLLDENGDRQLNAAYDPDAEYIPREQRPEWDCVGLMGKLRIRKGQVTGSRWIKMRDISDSVEEWLVR